MRDTAEKENQWRNPYRGARETEEQKRQKSERERERRARERTQE